MGEANFYYFTCLKSSPIFKAIISNQHSLLDKMAERFCEKNWTRETAPFDARFPNQNQTRNCYQNFLDFHRCQKVKGESHKPCLYFKRVYQSLCPNAGLTSGMTKLKPVPLLARFEEEVGKKKQYRLY